jgi:hypothetical protein
MSEDGRTKYLAISGNDAFCVLEASLILAEDR